MHYGEILTNNIANGTGVRLCLFVSGCRNHCKGCFQPETWDFCYGKEFTEKTEKFILEELEKDTYEGITILGGDPFEKENQPVVSDLIDKIRNKFRDTKNIWMYTGYIYDKDLLENGRQYTRYTDNILDKIDILVDGPFVEDLKNITLNFRGSSNQRIIKMPETRKNKIIIVSELNN